jgi:hypothetical protein
VREPRFDLHPVHIGDLHQLSPSARTIDRS